MRFVLVQTMLCAFVTGTVFFSCQDYGFQQVPTSVVREKRFTQTISSSSEVDILFVMDNSRSMVGEQTAIGKSFERFAGVLEEKFGKGKYRIAVITTGMESEDCQRCPADKPEVYSCINETGENGRFQDRIGRNVGDTDDPKYEFRTDASCRVITSDNKSCFYDKAKEEGTVFVGVRGCGYEKGLEPMRKALSSPLIDGLNSNFVRRNATLAVVVVTDEEDCGDNGDINEGISGMSARICYYASKGIDHNESTADPKGKPYALTPVKEYYDFLIGLKGGQKSMVKFAAIIGVKDADNPSDTTIEYVGNGKVEEACTTPGCSGSYCKASPGTRYVQLAEMFGLNENGLVDTICQNDFSETMEELGTFVACPREFRLSESILDPGLANILINNVPIPAYSCDKKGAALQECSPTSVTSSCDSGSSCVRTWDYYPPGTNPEPGALGGKIAFANHYDPCELLTDTIRIELIYATD